MILREIRGATMGNSTNYENERKQRIIKDMLDDYYRKLRHYVEYLEDKELEELFQFIKFVKTGHDKFCPLDLGAVKILFQLMYSVSDSDVQKILLYLESTGFGWQKLKYRLSNLCLSDHSTDHCKRMSQTSNPETALDQIEDLESIFFDEEYGAITLFIFCYCLAALFSKRLNWENFPVPFYLQIACDRHSVLFQLIEEIAEICDVNSGLIDSCSTVGKRRCGYRSQIYYPTQSTKNDLDALIRENTDVPVIVDGYENSTYYNNLLRSVANIPNSRTAIDLRDRFSVLPLFVCQTIKSSFGNVFNMDLSDLDISSEYLEFLRKHKRLLSSHVLEFIKRADVFLFYNQEEGYRIKWQPFKDHIGEYTDIARRQYPDLTLNNAKNIGFLNFFFNGFMNVFLWSFQFPEPITLHNQDKHSISKEKVIELHVNTARKSLAKLHLRYHPAPRSEGIQNKEAIQLAKKIMKCYAELHTFISVIPISTKDGRYIFRVETLQETRDSDVTSKMETVQHRLKKYECFRLDMTDGKEIRLIVSESQLQDSNLQNILNSEAFSDNRKKLPYAIGIDEIGQFYIDDIVDFPHLLLGGSTNSGKSTAIKSLLLSVAYKHQTGDAYVIIMDLLSDKDESKFSMFNDHPIMVCPVIQDPLKAAETIFALHYIMENRPKDRPANEVPYIVCVIDEFPTLYDIPNKDYVEQIKRVMSSLLSKGRHANIHLAIAAQDPSKDSVANVANAKVRMAFYCSHYRYSINIIGNGEAAKLQGQGQMILNSDRVRGKRLLGSFIDDVGMKKLLNDTKASFVQKNSHRPRIPDAEAFDTSVHDLPLASDVSTFILPQGSRFKTFEELLPDAIMWTLPQGKVANSRLLKFLHVRDAMGRQILDWMSKNNLIIQLNGNHGWKVIPECFEEIPTTILNYLGEKGISESEIRDVFRVGLEGSDTQDDAELSEMENMVSQEEVKGFCGNHRDIEEVDENDLSQVADIDNRQVDKETVQEHYTESNSEVPDFHGKEKNSELDLSQLETKQYIQSVKKYVKEQSKRGQGKRKPAH